MFDRKDIDRNIDWLVKYGTSPVKYLAHRDLIQSDEKVLSSLWQDVSISSEAQEIFSKQEIDGSWCAGGSWATQPKGIPKSGYSAFTPKYNTTVWVLNVLGEMGFTVTDERVRKAVDYTMQYQFENGLFCRPRITDKMRDAGEHEPENAPCELAVFLLGLGKVRAGDAVVLQKSWDLLERFQRDDGGWVREGHRIQRNWTRSCPWVSTHAVRALYHSHDTAYDAILKKGLDFLIRHLNLKTDDEIQRFFYHGHSQVHELVILSEYGIGLDERPVQSVLQWFLSMYDRDAGQFRYTGKSPSSFRFSTDYMNAGVAKYRLHHLIEDDWLTYWGTRIMMNLLANGY